jgi:RimJ/RimL family protein N-acetyltransferase
MLAFPIDRLHPPQRIEYRDDSRYLEIAPWTFEEIDASIAAIEASLPELRAFMPWAHLPLTREGQYRVFATFLADWWAGHQYVAALRGRQRELLGGIGLHPRTPLNPRALEVGYWSSTPHAGRGNVALAVRVMTVLAIDRFDCDRLQVLHDEANARSRRVVERCGFTLEGVVRNVIARPGEDFRRQGYCGTSRELLYAITPEDLPRLAWVEAVRANTTLVDAIGRVQAMRPGPPSRLEEWL